jgi:hypothetical protein
MGKHDRSRFLRALALGALLTASTGCEIETARYAPSMDVARKSLEAALTSWREGRPSGSIEGSSPPVQVVDSSWRSGEKLESFLVLGEEDVDGRKEFSVRLTMKEPRGTKEARYVVHGRDPIWVYRGEDFARAIDMGNQPESSRPRRPPRTISPRGIR